MTLPPSKVRVFIASVEYPLCQFISIFPGRRQLGVIVDLEYPVFGNIDRNR